MEWSWGLLVGPWFRENSLMSRAFLCMVQPSFEGIARARATTVVLTC